MSDEDKSLEDILGEQGNKAPLEAALENMTNEQFQVAVNAVNKEYSKRVEIKPSELNDAQFRELLRINGVD
jgi:hypothetical protein